MNDEIEMIKIIKDVARRQSNGYIRITKGGEDAPIYDVNYHHFTGEAEMSKLGPGGWTKKLRDVPLTDLQTVSKAIRTDKALTPEDNQFIP